MNMLNVKILLTGTVYNDGSRRNQEGLFLFRRFINLSLTYLRHLPTYLEPQTHTGLTNIDFANHVTTLILLL